MPAQRIQCNAQSGWNSAQQIGKFGPESAISGVEQVSNLLAREGHSTAIWSATLLT
jgi:hypothetical protein